jgi:hypothetical protein
MNFTGLFFQSSGSAGMGAVGGTQIFLVIALIFILLGSAFFAFVMLRKTVKMALRLIIVGVILLIAIVGGASFLWFSSGSGDSPKSRPNNTRSR